MERSLPLVSTAAIAAMVISVLIIVFIPVGLVVALRRRHSIALRPVAVGAAVFMVSQVLLRMPLLSFLGGQPWFPAAGSFTGVLLLAFSAGLFEEVGRFIGFKYFLRRHRQWRDGLAFGLGHGGIEAVALVGTTFIINILMGLAINSGTFDATFAQNLGSQAATVKELLTGTPSSHFLLGGIERVLTLAIHVALSILVLYGVVQGRARFLGLAIVLHGIVNIAGFLVMQPGYGIWLAEGYLLIWAVAALMFIRRSRSWFAGQQRSE